MKKQPTTARLRQAWWLSPEEVEAIAAAPAPDSVEARLREVALDLGLSLAPWQIAGLVAAVEVEAAREAEGLALDFALRMLTIARTPTELAALAWHLAGRPESQSAAGHRVKASQPAFAKALARVLDRLEE